MQTEQKAQLIERLRKAIDESGLSNNKFAEERLGITKGMLSQVLNNWQSEGIVGENTWNLITKYLSGVNGYKCVPTANFKSVCEACQQAYEAKANIPVIGEGGYGKSIGLTWFKQYQESIKGFKVYYVNAEGITTKKQLLIEVLRVLGGSPDGTLKQLILKIKALLDRQDCLLIIDEVSSLRDHNITVIKDLMTALKGICGIVFAGTPYFMNNLNKGANKNKHLFSETRDRLFNLTYELSAPTEQEAELIFEANGLDKDAKAIVLGKSKNKELARFAWYTKPTFRGISDAITAIRIALSETVIKYPQVIAI